MGNHVKFARFVLFPVSEKAKTELFFRSIYNKTIIRFDFSDIQNNPGLDKGCQTLSLRLITLTSTLISLHGYQKKPNPIIVYYCACSLWMWVTNEALSPTPAV